MSNSVYLAIPTMLFLTVVQTSILPRFPIFGLIPQLPFLVALAWGLMRDVDEGLLWAFVAGILLDLFSVTPLGISSLVFMGAVLAVTWTTQVLPESRFFLPMVQSVLATFVSLFLYLPLLSLFGHSTTIQAVAELLPLVLLHGLLILPVYWIMRLIDRRLRPRRVQI